ncbi:urease accessory protein UreF [Brotaphodocola sp.]|uniref:urease accessory protein UreF n=1 Tax=Brotaphodocola sp. TaxID=3073577 RepID=UPI003D7DAB52
MSDLSEQRKHYLLLQINDALFPIGGYSHSYGLETYIQKGIVKDAKTARAYIRSMLLHSFCQNELLTVAMAYDLAEHIPEQNKEILANLAELDETVTATRVAMEVRQAGEKLGSRFIKTVSAWEVPFESQIFDEYIKLPGVKNHPVVYGVFCAAAGIKRQMMLEHYLYAQTSAMVTNCVKTVPLSQTAGQQILFGAQELFDEVMARLEELDEDDLGAEAPGFEIRCMQHEALYSRLYMS